MSEWDGNERRDGKMSQDLMKILMEINSTTARIETNVINLEKLVDHHRKDFKVHMEDDRVNQKAMDLEISNINDKLSSENKSVLVSKHEKTIYGNGNPEEGLVFRAVKNTEFRQFWEKILWVMIIAVIGALIRSFVH